MRTLKVACAIITHPFMLRQLIHIWIDLLEASGFRALPLMGNLSQKQGRPKSGNPVFRYGFAKNLRFDDSSYVA